MPKRRANGEGAITQRKNKDGKKMDLWQAQFTDFTGKRRTVYGKTQQEALKKMKEAQGKSDMGISADGDKMTFAQWMIQWLEFYVRPTVRESTYTAYYNNIHIHIVPAFTNVLLKDLRTDMLQKFFNKKATSGRADKWKNPDTGKMELKDGGLSIGSLTKMKMIIVIALFKAIDNNLIMKNPAQSVKLPKPKATEVSILSVNEQKKLEEAVMTEDNPLSFCIILDLYTGMRIGEIIGLKISDVNLDKRELYVRRTMKYMQVKGEDVKTRTVINEPKTEKGKRTIPLPNFIVDLMKKHIKKRNEYMKVIGECFHYGDDDWQDEGYMFVTKNGTNQVRTNVRAFLERMLKKAGVKHIKIHALRHTFASRCIEAGFDIKTLADILGHKDPRITLGIYAHSLQEHKRNNMDKLTPLFNRQTEGETEQNQTDV